MWGPGAQSLHTGLGKVNKGTKALISEGGAARRRSSWHVVPDMWGQAEAAWVLFTAHKAEWGLCDLGLGVWAQTWAVVADLAQEQVPKN